jgi:DNA-binding IclR family transcriptional regulator
MPDRQGQLPSAETAAAETDREPAYRAPAAEKALDILEFMAAAAEARTQTEIAAGVGRSIHEVYRIIQLLERRGYIGRAGGGDGYILTLKLFGMAHQSPPLATLTSAAAEPMRRLADIACQSCHLAILTGREVTVVAQVTSPQPMFYAVTLGARFPVQETSSGLVLMAGLQDQDRERLLAAIGATGADIDAMRANLAPVLRSGFDVRPSMMVPGVVNVSFPVRNYVGATVGALTLPYLPVSPDTPSLERAQAATAEAAKSISASLGFAAGGARAA